MTKVFHIQLALVQIISGHGPEGKLGNITFRCASDEDFADGYCLTVVDAPMIWKDADRACKRKGQDLMYAADADEHMYIDHFAKRTWEYYWTGLNRLNTSLAPNEVGWSHNADNVDFADLIWENDQPERDNGDCVYTKKNGYKSFGNCWRRLPFICKSEAVLKGFFRCRNGLGIQTKFVCDSHNDCGDRSDENNCPDIQNICSEVIDATTTTSGTISSAGIYANKKTCYWSIITNIGSTIKVTVNTFNTERNADVMDFTTGGLQGIIVLAELGGNVQGLPFTYFSSDNVFNMRLLTDDTILKAGFSISWTTDVPEIFSDVQMLTATSTMQSLKSPFYDTNYLVHEKVFEWIITSNTVITLQFANMDIDDKGKLYLWEDDEISLNTTLDVNKLPEDYIFISRSKTVRLMLVSGADSFTFSKGIHIKYWEGCDINLQANKGTIYSPGSKADSYPDNVKCTWTMQRETSETRPMSLRFTEFKLQQDKDFLKVYNDTGDDSPVHSGNGFTGSVTPPSISSTTGYIKAEFTSDYVLTDDGFSADFSLDCPELVVSSQTHVTYSEGTLFNSEVTVSCDTGYSFVQEEYNTESSVKMNCMKGGKWDKDRTPNCMMTYCPIPPAIDNGYISESAGVMYGGNVTYLCNSGFTGLGTSHIECKANGQWEIPMRCDADKCPALTTPANGDYLVLEGGPEGRDFASVVQVVCDPGYETLGNLTTYCKTGGTWSHMPASCNKLFCPSPMFKHGSLDEKHGMIFEEDIKLTCDSGFGINGTTQTEQSLTCGSDRLFTPVVSCMDINECEPTSGNGPCPATENCHNTRGSYMCTCKPGYMRESSDADCTDINECVPNGGKGPCDHTCSNDIPGYTCQCNLGYLLYTEDEISNISLAEGEDGMRDGDVYRFDHTCVRKQCAVPPPISHGMVLSKKNLFYYEDTVEFKCDSGYKLSGQASTMCQPSGIWSNAFPTCLDAECTTSSVSSIARSTNIYPGESTSVIYGTMVNIECQYGSQKINRTLYCAYKGNDVYGLLGDSPECPEINCESPEEIPGKAYSGLSTTTLDSKFTFGCEEGFIKSGMSLEGTDVVTCQENGRWSIGNLTCTGGRCTDPGTPGGAEQEVESYEVGKFLYFKCNKDGYLPEPPAPLECIVDTSTENTTIRWNTTDLPECLDKTAPMFTNCPTSPVYVDKTEQYMYTIPMATDNSGAVKRIINTGGYYSGLRINTDIDIRYTAMDFSGNSMHCTIEVRVKDRNVPVLICPPILRESISMASGKGVDISNYVNTTGGDFTMTYTPSQIVNIDHTTIGDLQRIDVKAEDKWGAEDTCSFLLETRASACFRESFPQSVANADITCTSANISCTVKCKSGYIFSDGNNTKTYDCENNQWTPVLPPDSCIKYDDPSYLIKFQLVYQSVVLASKCQQGHEQILTSKNATFTSELNAVCNNAFVTAGQIAVSKMESSSSSFDFKTEFTIKLLDTTVAEDKKKLCESLIKNQLSKTDFLDYSELASCTVNPGTTQVTRHTSSENKILSSGNQCESAALKPTVIGDKCVPCPPGTFSSGPDTCTECPEGRFQSSYGETECYNCPGTDVPSDDNKKCVEVCPIGFNSITGLPPCDPCPEDQYWVNKTTCQMCPDGGSTIGINAVASQAGCKSPCSMGEYSVTGYISCMKCPVNFYQNRTQQDMCEPCTGKQITVTDGSEYESDCIDLDWEPTDSGTVCCDACPGGDVNGCCQANCSQELSSKTCSDRCNDANDQSLTCQCGSDCIQNKNCCPDYKWKCVDVTLVCTNTTCNGNGNCIYKNNRKFCECNTGYVGETCNMELDPCDSNPCWNGGTCIKTGYDSFNCSCPVDTSCSMDKQDGLRGKDADWLASGVAPFPATQEKCQSACLTNPDCTAIHYTSNNCFVFYTTNSGLETAAGSTFWSKQCVNMQLFGCDLCEDDLVNSCTEDTCTEYGMCQDLVEGDPKCLCPTTGVYTQPKCERETNPCNPDPCKNDGTCVSYNVRYHCICKPGFTGKECEKNIDDCGNNPDGCLHNGTCNDGDNMYTCTCTHGFIGDRCKERPDFCDAKPCPTGICYNNYDSFNFECKCEDPYRNDNTGRCEMIPPCESKTCVNGTCGSNGECNCHSGFEGSLCQHNIDNCKNMPCQNNGTCMDKLNGYDCECVTGYDGADCSNDINDCDGMCTEPNAAGCVDMLNDYECTCKPGYMGRNCTEDIDECNSSPCQHSGTCQNMENDFNCSCYEGWTGKMCETPVEYCEPSPCQNGVCYNLTDSYFCKCQSGTTGVTCNDFPEVCNIINPCTNGATCSNKGGTAKCSCTDNYDGSSCQLIQNHCADSDTCKNDGTCMTKDMGFQCECKSSYEGDTCETYKDPCDPNPCHSSAKCLSEENRHMCYCAHGRLLTDEGCKVPSDPRAGNFDILLDSRVSPVGGFLRTPFVWPTDSNITVMFWTRIAVASPSPLLVSLEASYIGALLPTWNPASWTTIIYSDKVITNNFQTTSTIEFGTDVADGKWHFLVVSWEQTGNIRIFIDSIKKVDQTTLTADSVPMIMYAILGYGTYGRLSKLNVYRKAYSDEKLILARASYNHFPIEDLVQGWYNVALTHAVTKIYPSEIEDETICDIDIPQGCPVEDRKKPTVTCPADKIKTAIGRLTPFTGLKTEGVYSDDVTSKSSSVHKDEVYFYGSRNEALVGYDAAGNYGICRFKVYVKYNDDCPAPATDATVEHCTGNSGNICGLQCPANQILSMKHPFRYHCGMLGIHNQVNPWMKFVVPTCGEKAEQTVDLTVSMSFELSLDCYAAAIDGIKTKVEDQIKGYIATNWPDLCRSPCTPTVNSQCRDSTKFVDAVFTLHSLGSETTKNSVTYKMREAILIVILTENVFGGFSGIAGADLQKDTVTVTESPSCPADFVVIGDECVKCGKGTYRNETTMSCQYCAVGMYKTTVGPTSCTPCGSGKTTVTYGSYSSSDCIDDCSIGHEYKGSECVECERHYYQDRSGLDYCLPCPLGTKTSVKGSNSSTSCYEDCPAGTELQPDGSCKDCRRGYYRSQADDNCLSCEDVRPGMTTEDIKSTTSSDCNIKICLAGKFRNTTNECEPCKVGEYNPEDLQDSCEECPTSHTTDGEGKTHRDNCTFYCDAGKEVMSAESKSCRPCPRGTYRSLNMDEILEPCQNCSHGNTTENTSSTSEKQCTIKRCEAGQKLDDTGACEDCHADYYQSDDHPDSNTVCTACDDDKGTMQPKSDSEDKCILVCSAGEQNNGDSCTPCPQGTWNNGDMNMRFDQCSNCTDQDYTTFGQGSTHPDNCTLRNCDPGYYISGSNCLPCGFAQYQPMRHQEMCLNCSTNQNTSSEASTSQSDCQIYCPEGKEGNVTCTLCQEDYYKSVAGISACTACTGNYTSNAARVACTEIFCDRGLYNDNDNCIVCPVGQYKHIRGNAQSCTPCDLGWTTPGVASEAESECNVLFCVPGKFENTTSNQCEPCKVKTYKALSGNQACMDCPQNKTTQGTTSTMASDCSVEFCDPGERRTTSNKCELCAVGYYQPDAGEDSCIGCDTGYTTDSSGKTLKSDCYEICRAGFQFDANNKVCIGCALGYYKNVVGNSVNCSECPTNKTTGNVNSTSIGDCNINDCQPGYRREAGGLGCLECEIGKYQPQRSQPSCLSCGSTKTTKSTGSSKLAECIIICGDGFEADYQGGCKPCQQGFFSNAANKECTACPNGQTTSSGSNVCITNTITTLSPPVRRILNMKFRYRGAFACDDNNIRELVRGKIILRLTVLASVYTRLCYPDTISCTNIQTLSISISVCNVAGRKRAADNMITYDVKVTDVPDSVTNKDTSATRPTSTVLQQDLTVNKESYNPEPEVLTIEDAKVQSVCPAGSVVNNQNCEQCGVGTYYDSNTCLQCPLHKYQTLTGQSSCTPCTGVKKYTLSMGSNSSSYCVSECVTQENYCNTGSCRDDFSLTCVCPDEYEGVTCQTRKEKTSSTPAIIGGAIGGGVALLIFITIIIIVCSRFYGSNKSEDSDSRKFGRYNDTESDAPYRNPIYDNRAYRSGHLPITYGGSWPNEYPGGHDPYAPYIAQKHLRTFDSDNEEGTTGRSPRRTQHEWYAA